MADSSKDFSSKDLKNLTEAIKTLINKIDDQGRESTSVASVERQRKYDKLFESYIERSLKEADLKGAFGALKTGIEKQLINVSEQAEEYLLESTKELAKKKEELAKNYENVSKQLDEEKDPGIKKQLEKKKAELLANLEKRNKQIAKKYEDYEKNLSDSLFNLQDELAENIKETAKDIGVKKFKSTLASKEDVDSALTDYKAELQKQYKTLQEDTKLRESLGITDEKLDEVKQELTESYLAQLSNQTKNLALDDKTRKVLEDRLKKEKILLGQSTYEQTYGDNPIGKLTGRLADFTTKRFKQQTEKSSEFTKITNAFLGAFFKGKDAKPPFLNVGSGPSVTSRSKEGILTPEQFAQKQKEQLSKLQEENKVEPEKEKLPEKVEPPEAEKAGKGVDQVIIQDPKLVVLNTKGKTGKKEVKVTPDQSQMIDVSTEPEVKQLPLPETKLLPGPVTPEPVINVTPEVEKEEPVIDVTPVVEKEEPVIDVTPEPIVNESPEIEKIGEMQQTLEQATENVPLKTIITSFEPEANKQLRENLMEAFNEALKTAFDTLGKEKPKPEKTEKTEKPSKEEESGGFFSNLFGFGKGAASIGKGAANIGKGAAGTGALSSAGAFLTNPVTLAVGTAVGSAAIGYGLEQKFGTGTSILKNDPTAAVATKLYAGKTIREMEEEEKRNEELNDKIQSAKDLPKEDKKLAYFQAQKESLEIEVKAKTGEEREEAKKRLESVNKTIKKLEDKKKEAAKAEDTNIEKVTAETNVSEQDQPAVMQESAPVTTEPEQAPTNQEISPLPDQEQKTVMAEETPSSTLVNNQSNVINKLEKTSGVIPTLPSVEGETDLKPEMDTNNKLTANTNQLLNNNNELLGKLINVVAGKNTGGNAVVPVVIPSSPPQQPDVQSQSPAWQYRSQNRLPS